MLPRLYVSRPRLLEMLSQATQSKLTIVCADAGYGKTSLVTEFTRQEGLRVEWHQFTRRDLDIVRLGEALELCLRRLTDDPEQSATIGTPFRRSKGRDIQVLTEFLLSSAARVGPQVSFLVLDDYQNVDQESVANQLLGSLIEDSPPDLHFIIMSRCVPKFPLGRLKARQEVYSIGEDALAFALEETRQFLSSNGAEVLEESTLALVQERTEGWPAGIAMVSQSLRYGDQAKVMSVLADPAASTWLVYDYLAEEVFDRQEQAVKDFLVRTSILGRLDADVCDSLLSITSAYRTLLSLEEGGLFTTSVDPARQVFRYHQLFREFLRQKLYQLESRDAVRRLHLRAAQYYESHHSWDDCVDHYVKAGDVLSAARVVELVGEKHLMAGFVQTVNAWLQSLPEDLTTTRPWLLLLRGRIAYLSVDNPEALRLLDRALRAFQTVGDRYGEVYSLREIGFVRHRSHQIHQTIRQYEAALPRAGENRDLKGWILCRIARVYRDVGRLAESLDVCKAARAEVDGIEDETERIRVLSMASRHSAIAQMEMGDLKPALVSGLESLDLGSGHDVGEYERSWELIDLGIVLWSHGEFDGAMEALNRALALSGRHIKQVQEKIGSWLGTVLRDTGRFAEAERAYVVGGWEAGLESAFMSVVTRQADVALARARDLDREWLASDHLLAKAWAKVVLAAALRESGELSEALGQLLEGVGILEQGGYRFRLASALLHQARIEYDLSLPRASDTLAKALGIAARGEFFHFFWWDPRLISFLCEKALEDGIQPDYVARLMERRLRASGVELLSGPAQGHLASPELAPEEPGATGGADGLDTLLRRCSDQQVRETIRRAVSDGLVGVDGLRSLRFHRGLTWREIEVFLEYYLRPASAPIVGADPLREGCAKRLGISESTVRYHVSSIRRKLALPGSLSGRAIASWLQNEGWMTYRNPVP